MPLFPLPQNEPVRSYAPGSLERTTLQQALAEQSIACPEIPLWIDGKPQWGERAVDQVLPHCHAKVLARWHRAGRREVQAAIAAALRARREWAAWKFEDRAAVFLRAAELLTTTWRSSVNASTMLNQSKTAHQSEIDVVCELADFFRFNVHFADRIRADQPLSPPGAINSMDYRPLEGFVYAVTPFNFTSIAGNLPTAPALMGNTVVWKCASSTVFSNYRLMELLQAAGLPPGVINFVPGDAARISEVVLNHPELAGVHFTGSTDVFRAIWRTVGNRIEKYRTYPRLVGETGGKDFIVVHASADPDAVMTAIVRGGYEYQGQKCSAASRVYLPDGMWRAIRKSLAEQIETIPMGDVSDFTNFMGAVIDRPAFERITTVIAAARRSSAVQIVAGGTSDDAVGYFVRPTLLQTINPDHTTMREEVFGPVVTIYVYKEKDWHSVLQLIDRTSRYSLTGAVLATDRGAIQEASAVLRDAAGNFYINDKPTGAVVGQQPFGGARSSGTNDKAGSPINLLRWSSPRVIKETLVPPGNYRYPYMEDN